MSRTRSTNTGSSNPSAKFIEWKSSKKAWTYYDKELEKEVEIPFDGLAFIVLDELNTVKGYDKATKKGMWSNEVRNVTKEEFCVRWKDGVVIEGLWNDIKGKDRRLSFTKSVYVMAKGGDGYELVNLQLRGGAMGKWFDFTKENDVNGNLVISATSLIEDGENTFPGFAVVSKTLSAEASAQADKMDEKLQVYLDSYFGSEQAAPQTPSTDTPAPDKEEEEAALDEEPPF